MVSIPNVGQNVNIFSGKNSKRRDWCYKLKHEWNTPVKFDQWKVAVDIQNFKFGMRDQYHSYDTKLQSIILPDTKVVYFYGNLVVMM